MQRSAQIFDQVAGVFKTDRQSDRALGDAGRAQRGFVHAVVRGGSRMNDQGFGVPDIGQVRKHPQPLDKAAPRRTATFETETEDRAAAAWQNPGSKGMVGMRGQFRIGHRFDGVVPVQKGDDLAGIVDVFLHPERQRFDPLQNLKGIHRTHAGAEIAQALAPRTQQKGAGGRLFAEHHAVKSGIGFGQGRKPAGFFPVEFAAIHHHAADGNAMSAEKLGRGVE